MEQVKDRLKDVDISKEMRKSFLDYSMSVIVDRALPDVRDGLKPVHRRILHAMNELGIVASKPFKKSARIVGEVIGKYHPHGDTAVYDSMVRMAQDFSYRYMLVEGHGNFGSMDGDGAAAMRYTEAKMSKIAMEMIRDINKDTVDFQPNYDGEESEPKVMPARFPNLIVNGAVGIAVGMATNIPPHNLNETIDAIIAVMDQSDITVPELMENYLKGPDFPTGGLIMGRSGIRQAYETGRGSIVLRSKYHVEDMDNGKHRIVVTEIPYQVNKANLITKIADVVRDKQVEGITYLNDESNREGVRIVIELKKDVQVDVVMNQLFRLTSLQTSFGINMLALVNGAPKQMGIKEMITHYTDHQVEVIERRTRFDLNKALDRAHILEGLRIALDHIDEIIDIIRSSKTDREASDTLIQRFNLSEIQANAILEMRLKRLTGLERDKIENEYQALLVTIADLQDILANPQRVLNIIREELLELKDRFGDDRRTEISDDIMNLDDEDLIPVEEIVVTMSSNGYIKRIPSDTYRAQNRGGKGVKGMSVNDDDMPEFIMTLSTHDHLLIFSNKGKVYRIKGYKVPLSSRTAKGLPIVNLIDLDKDEKVQALLAISKDSDAKYIVFATKNGLVKRTDIAEFDSIRQSGKIAISLREDDELLGVKTTNGDEEIIIASANGKAVRFNENDIRVMGRSASGVKGINPDGSKTIGIATSNEGKYLLSISENGYGKRSEIDDYRLTSRGTKGVKSMNLTAKTGDLVSVRAVSGDEDVMIMSDSGIIIRIPIESIGIYSRNTQGVRLINLNDDEKVLKSAILAHEEEESSENSEDSQPVIDNQDKE